MGVIADDTFRITTSNTERDDFRNRLMTVTAEADDGVRASVTVPESIQETPELLAGLVQALVALADKAGTFR